MLSSHVVLCCDQKSWLDAEIATLSGKLVFLKTQNIDPKDEPSIKICEEQLADIKYQIETIENKFDWVDDSDIDDDKDAIDDEDVADCISEIDSTADDFSALEDNIDILIKQYTVHKAI